MKAKKQNVSKLVGAIASQIAANMLAGDKRKPAAWMVEWVSSTGTHMEAFSSRAEAAELTRYLQRNGTVYRDVTGPTALYADDRLLAQMLRRCRHAPQPRF